MNAAEAERACWEYVLGLDGMALGARAQTIVGRHMARDIRPVLLRQRALLDRALKTGANTDAEVKQLEAELAAAWGRCLDALKTLWLTEGPSSEEAA